MKKKLLAGLVTGLFLFCWYGAVDPAHAITVQVTYSGQFSSSYEDILQNTFPTAGIEDGQKYYGIFTYDTDSPMLYESWIGYRGKYDAISATFQYAGLTWSATVNNEAIQVSNDIESGSSTLDRFWLQDHGNLLLNGEVIGTTDIWTWWADYTHSAWDTYTHLPSVEQINSMNLDSSFFRWKIWVDGTLVTDVISSPSAMTASVPGPPKNTCLYYGDFDCDGDIDGSDLAQFATLFGKTYTSPQPLYP